MRKLFNKPWFVALLAAAALAFVGSSLLPKKNSDPQSIATGAENSADDTTSEAAAATPKSPAAIRAAIKEIPQAATLRDPFAAHVQVATSAPEKIPEPDLTESVNVTAVWIQGTTSFALINNRICTVGDKIGRITFESATPQGIWLKHWKGRDFVTVGSAFTLKTPAQQAAVAALSSES